MVENVNSALTESDEQLLEAAAPTTVDYSDETVAPSVSLGEPCDI